MRSIERRFNIEMDKSPQYSTFVNFCHAVQHQQFSKQVIIKWFNELVDPEDYDKSIKKELIEHVLELSFSSKLAVAQRECT